jgi:hypothetical protein
MGKFYTEFVGVGVHAKELNFNLSSDETVRDIKLVEILTLVNSRISVELSFARGTLDLES